MRLHVIRQLASLIAALIVGLAVPAPGGSAEPAASGLKYLLFEMYTYLPINAPRLRQLVKVAFPNYTGPVDAAQVNAYAITKPNIEAQVDNMLAAVRERGDHVRTQLGVMLGPLAFDLTDDQLRTVIRNAFAVAEEKDVAVGFHVDDSMFWLNRQDLWSDRNAVEWSDWQGTPIAHRFVGWVEEGAAILAPPMCYTNPKIRAEALRVARDVIGAEIRRGMQRLAAIGKPYLFAGVIADWEAQVPHKVGDNDNLYGYCALHHLGYSAAKPPADIDLALQEVVRDWIILWCKAFADAGIPRQRIYTHVVFPGLGPPAGLRLPRNFSVLRNMYADSDPDVTPFNNYSIPGFSVYGANYLPGLYQILARHGNPPWGISEGSIVDVQAGGRVPSTMEKYLAGAYNHGAVFVTLFQWRIGAPDPYIAGSEPIAAYRKFLSGARLQE